MGSNGTSCRPCRDKVVIREGTFKDEVFVADLAQEVFSIYGEYRQILPRCLINPYIYTAVAQVEDTPVGFGMLTLEINKGEVLAIAVDPDHHNRGIGRRLMTILLREAGKFRFRAVTLKTASDNVTAQGLFSTLGFEVTGENEDYYTRGQSAMEMVKRL